MERYLVLIETSGIQSFIFDTNKRRENVGASQLVDSVGGWAEEELTRLVAGWSTRSVLHDGSTETAAELLTKAAGSAKVLVTDAALARQLIAAVTRRALVEAPGLDVCGVYVGFDWAVDGKLAGANRAVHDLIPAARSARPGPEVRFLRLPIVDQCASSGLPASHLCTEGGRRSGPDGAPIRVARSRPSHRKLGAAGPGYNRLAGMMVDGLGRVPAEDDSRQAATRARARAGIEAVADYLERRAEWVAVVHADGNDLGRRLATLAHQLPHQDSRTFATALRSFSEGLQAIAENAYRQAVADLENDPHVPRVRRPDGVPNPPVLPLVLGGDDLTVVCDGAAALPFTVAYLRHFEEQAATRLCLPGHDRLSACAGVAIVKAHYPFSSAYRLTEELMDEAKQVKRKVSGPASAFSFHILHDSAAIRLEELRDRQTVDNGETLLVAQPYLVAGPPGGWAEGRRWEDLARRVAALRARSDGTPGPLDGALLLPRSQTHSLRDRLFDGQAAADSHFTRLLHRYRDRGLDRLAVDGSLFWTVGEVAPDRPGECTVRVTGLLDAMDADAFLGTLPGQAETTAPQPVGVAR